MKVRKLLVYGYVNGRLKHFLRPGLTLGKACYNEEGNVLDGELGKLHKEVIKVKFVGKV